MFDEHTFLFSVQKIGISYKVKKRASNCTHSTLANSSLLLFYPYPFGGPYLPFARFQQCIGYIYSHSGGLYLSFAKFQQCIGYSFMILVDCTFLSTYSFSAPLFNLGLWWSVPSFRLISSVHWVYLFSFWWTIPSFR